MTRLLLPSLCLLLLSGCAARPPPLCWNGVWMEVERGAVDRGGACGAHRPRRPSLAAGRRGYA